MPVKDNALILEASQSFEEGATVVPLDDGGIRISVAEEKAVDSYNQSFTCSISMTKAQAAEFYEWLGKVVKPANRGEAGSSGIPSGMRIEEYY